MAGRRNPPRGASAALGATDTVQETQGNQARQERASTAATSSLSASHVTETPAVRRRQAPAAPARVRSSRGSHAESGENGAQGSGRDEDMPAPKRRRHSAIAEPIDPEEQEIADRQVRDENHQRRLKATLANLQTRNQNWDLEQEIRENQYDEADEGAAEEEAPRRQNASAATAGRPTNQREQPHTLTQMERIMLEIRSAPKPPAPVFYEGKTLEALRNFERECDIAFRSAPYAHPTDVSKVIYGVSYCRGDARTRWDAHERVIGKDKSTWSEFIEWLRDGVEDPVNRGSTAYRKLHEAMQREGQSVQSFVTYIESLEKDVAPIDSMHRMHNLLNKLSVDVRDQINAFEVAPTNYDEMISAAARIEEHIRKNRNPLANIRRLEARMTKAENGGQSTTIAVGDKFVTLPSFNEATQIPVVRGRGNGFRGRGRGGNGYRGRGGNASGVNATPVTSQVTEAFNPNAGIRCFKCSKMGHYSTSCPELTLQPSKNGQTPH